LTTDLYWFLAVSQGFSFAKARAQDFTAYFLFILLGVRKKWAYPIKTPRWGVFIGRLVVCELTVFELTDVELTVFRLSVSGTPRD